MIVLLLEIAIYDTRVLVRGLILLIYALYLSYYMISANSVVALSDLCE